MTFPTTPVEPSETSTPRKSDTPWKAFDWAPGM